MTTTAEISGNQPATADTNGNPSPGPVSGLVGDRGPITDLHYDLGWLGLAAASVVLVGLVAPSGLLLLAFLGVIILTHEAGHLLAARAAGMAPTEFFWGFGPEIVSFQRNGCRYGLRALFLGGYVKIEGMTPDAELPDGVEEAGTYRAASIRGRLSTILAGPFTNLATAVAALTWAGLRAGESPGRASVQALTIVGEIASATVLALWSWVANIGGYLGAVFGDTAQAPVRFLSPVAQARISGQVVDAGLDTSLYWFAILACAVGVVNLLPIPPLDGSHAAVALTEGVVRRLTGRSVSLDVGRLVPLAYVTVAVLGLLSLTALIMDLRDLSVF